jgi:hypothetical protein
MDMELQNQLLNQSSLFYETLENEFAGDETFKDVKIYIPTEGDQRLIINSSSMSDAKQIVERLEAQFHQDADSLRSVQF